MVLAVVDTRFPWVFSGFRYWENFEFYKIDKSILFFSLHKTNDYFPAPVLPLSSLRDYPVSDIYCVFLNHTLGLLDCPLEIPGKQNYGFSQLIRDRNIAVHSTIGPGGGYEDVSHWNTVVKGLEFLRDHSNVKSVFTNLRVVQEVIPGSLRIEGIVNTDFYRYNPRTRSEKLHLLFVAHRPLTGAQKGLEYLLKAFNSLDSSKFHLHIVGEDWSKEIKEIRHNNYTYYGTLPPEKLRDVFDKCHVVVNPAYRGNIPFLGIIRSGPKQYVSIDSFPTIAAAEAMSTGCCLISTNPRHENCALSAGADYVEIRERSTEDLLIAVESLYRNQDEMLSMANRGNNKIREFFDAKKNVRLKYNMIKGKHE